jgi:hypothetical protein
MKKENLTKKIKRLEAEIEAYKRLEKEYTKEELDRLVSLMRRTGYVSSVSGGREADSVRLIIEFITSEDNAQYLIHEMI